MRRLIEAVLHSQGWTVRLAEGAHEALEWIEKEAQPPAVVVCDVLMPRVDGMELVRKLCAMMPGLNVIFISGHLSDVSWWPNDLREHRFLPKPFENAQLVKAIKEATGL